jgi:hypothetical protein
MEDRRRECTHADGEKHVTQLAHRRVRQYFFDIVLRQRDGRREERRRRADHSDQRQGCRRHREEEMQPSGHVNARSHHRGGMDQSAHRRGSGHGVGKPDEQRYLRRFSRGANEQQKCDQRDGAGLQHLHMLVQLDEI